MGILKKQFGFSLVELSVSLAVIGVTMGGALTLATKKTESDKLTETQTKMAAIDAAMDVYLTQNQRLPCPADGASAINSNTFGVAGTVSGGACTPSVFNVIGAVYAGVVPTKTLGLPDSTMIDGWGRRISYVVDFNFVNNNNAVPAGVTVTNATCDGVGTGAHLVCFKYKSAGAITVNDSTGVARTTTAVYALISHGKNGKGAYTYAGSATRLATSTDAGEMSNAGNDAGAFDAVFVQKDTDTAFDDIVTYRNKAEIMDDSNAETDGDLCTLSDASVSAANCNGAASSANCVAFSTTISTLCLDM
ncbi:MAG: type secretion system protein [Rickettsiaceae bacterium]|jgi:prepilin-type N-terminal cleavage/methylation domain-containing protein|nr:type secretion system protein [Rickettsiaceae bacterium]